MTPIFIIVILEVIFHISPDISVPGLELKETKRNKRMRIKSWNHSS